MYKIQLNIKSYQKSEKLKKRIYHLIKNFNSNKINIKENVIIKKNKKFTLLKSPHVNKKAQEHFIFETFKQSFLLKHEDLKKLLKLILLIKKTNYNKTLLTFKLKR